jgi:hypothetical protein
MVESKDQEELTKCRAVHEPEKKRWWTSVGVNDADRDRLGVSNTRVASTHWPYSGLLDSAVIPTHAGDTQCCRSQTFAPTLILHFTELTRFQRSLGH